MRPLSQAYHELATAYATSSSDEVRNIINKFRDIFVRDVNMGLVKLVIMLGKMIQSCLNYNTSQCYPPGRRFIVQEKYPTTYKNFFNIVFS